MKIIKLFFTLTILIIGCNSAMPASYYWVGGTGNWDELTHWATSSGGSTYHIQIPSAVDDVFFDANSFSADGQTVTINVPTALCRNMNWSAITKTVTFVSSNTIDIYGSLVFSSLMSLNLTGTVNFEATTTGHLINSAGKSFSGPINFNGIGGSWSMQNTLVTSTSSAITLNNGSLTTNSYAVSAYLFNSNNSNVRSLTLGSSVLNFYAYTTPFWNVSSTNFTFDAGTSTIKSNGHFGGFTPSFSGGNLIYYDLEFVNTTDQPGSTSGNNTFHNVTFNAVSGYTGSLNNNNTANNVIFKGHGSITGSNTIHKAEFYGNGSIGNGNNIIDSVIYHQTGTLGSGTNTVDYVEFMQNGNLTGNNTINDLYFEAGYTYTLTTGKTQTIVNDIYAVGNCGAMITIKSNTTSSATISHSSGSITVDYVYLNYITATGGATFTANNSIDLGNNSGWTINTLLGKDLYWIGNGGNWDDGNHWSLTSGGAPSGCAPTSLDNVFFDANSFTLPTQTVTINIPTASCYDMDWTGMNQTTTFSSSNTLNIYGSLTFSSTMTLSLGGTVNFEATSSGQTINTAGKSFSSPLNFNGIGGEWTLLNSLNTSTNSAITLNNGSLITNSQAVSGYLFNSNNSNVRSLTLGSSVLNFYAYTTPFWNVISTNFTLDAGTSTIISNGHFGGFTPSFSGGNLIYYDLIFANTVDQPGSVNGNNTFHDITFNAVSGYTGSVNNNNFIHNVLFKGHGSITGSNTIHKAEFYGNGSVGNGNNVIDSLLYHQTGTLGSGTNTVTDAIFYQHGNLSGNNTFNKLWFTPGYTYTLTSGKTQTIMDSLFATGNCGALITIKSNTTSQTTISKSAGNVTVDYVYMSYLNATGGATFTANNAVDLGNNTGWTINTLTGKNLFWIGNSGNWDDGNHWSLTSGGAPSGCAPTSLDNVFFDGNSFSLAGQTVTVNIPSASCNHMDWTGMNYNTSFTSSNTLNIYGSLTFSSTMLLNFSGTVNFESTGGTQYIYSAGKSFGGPLNFNGIGGEWFLTDALFTSTSAAITLNNGILVTNSYPLRGYLFNSNNTNNRSLALGSSVLNFYAYTTPFWNVISTNFTFDAGTSTIISNGHFGGFTPSFSGGSMVYYDLEFANTVDQPGSTNGNNTFHNVTFNAVSGYTGSINNNNTINDVLFKGHGSITGSNTINNVEFFGNGSIGNGNNIIDSVIYHQTGSLGTGTNTINYAEFMQNGNLTGNNTFTELTFTPGYTYTLTVGKTQTIIDKWNILGTCVSYIIIQSSSAGSQATVSKSGSDVIGFNLHIRDINAIGGADYYALNSVDLGGNSGWNFSTLPSLGNPLTINGQDTICSGLSGLVYYIPPVSGALNYQWTVPPGATITSGQGDTLIVVDFGTATSGYVTVEAFNGCAYSDSSSLAINIFTTVAASVSIAVSPSDSICSGTNVTFTATPVNGGALPLFQWKKNGADISGETDTTYISATLTDNDTITCVMTSSFPCVTGSPAISNDIVMSVGISPSVYNVTGGGSYCTETSGVPLGLSGSDAGIIYQIMYEGTALWNPFAGTGSALNFGDQIAAGNYKVVATDATSGCQKMMNDSADVDISNCAYQYSAVSINHTGATADSSAVLDINVTDGGLLIPRLSDNDRDSIPSPAAGLLIYNITTNTFNYYCATGWYEIPAIFVSSTTGSVTLTNGVVVNRDGYPAANSAMLDIHDDNKGMLIPRTLPGAILGPAEGLILYNIYGNRLNYYDGITWNEVGAAFVSSVTGTGSFISDGCAVNLTGATPDPSSALDISAVNRGILIPRLTDSQRDALLPATGLLIYNLDTKSLEYFNGTAWYRLQ